MGSIHGRRLIYRSHNRRRQTLPGECAMRPPARRCGDGASSAAKQTPTSTENLAILQPRWPQMLGRRVHSCASARAEVYCDSNRTVQNDPSYQNSIARTVALGAAWRRSAVISWPNAAHRFPFRKYVARRLSSV